MKKVWDDAVSMERVGVLWKEDISLSAQNPDDYNKTALITAAKQNDPDVPPNFDFGPAETLQMIKNPFPRNRFSRPKKYKLALEEKWKKKMRQ